MKKKNIMMITMVIVSTLVLLLTVACISRPVTDDVVQDSTPSENIVTTKPQPEQDTEDTTASTENATDEPTQPETNQVDNTERIIGKYTWVSESCQKALKDNPEYLPAITFNNDDTCEMLVYYFGGSTLFSGIYMIDDNKIFVDLDLESEGSGFEGTIPNTDQPYMDDKYVFEIIDYDHITIGPAEGAYHNGNCYVVRSGDPFERQ